jgi:hypothetical protein
MGFFEADLNWMDEGAAREASVLANPSPSFEREEL